MKKIALLGLIASALVIASCASKDNTANQAAPMPAPTHQDLKGEVGSK